MSTFQQLGTLLSWLFTWGLKMFKWVLCSNVFLSQHLMDKHEILSKVSSTLCKYCWILYPHCRVIVYLVSNNIDMWQDHYFMLTTPPPPHTHTLCVDPGNVFGQRKRAGVKCMGYFCKYFTRQLTETSVLAILNIDSYRRLLCINSEWIMNICWEIGDRRIVL